MDLSKVLEQLRKELESLDVAILTLERLQEKAVRRGRPPKLLASLREVPKASSPVVSVGLPRRSSRGG
jgi:hypothetical protein